MATINVLSIGNSFSDDAQRYLHELARSEGVKLETINLFIGGCSLALHFRNMAGDKKAYRLGVNGHGAEGFMSSISEALLARDWDYITLQQASHFSFDEDSYEPYISELAEYVRSLCPKAKILVHQTWGYESGSTRCQQYGFETYEEMFARVKYCYEKAADSIQADGILPCGAAFEYALHNGIQKIHRDTFHASYGVGRFILALVWYHYITGNDISNVSFCDFDEEVGGEAYRIAVEAAKFAVGQMQ